MSQKEKSNVCSGCGLPPRRSTKTDAQLKLRRCSQCQNAWYHDVKCQRKHFPMHRKECQMRRLAVASASTEQVTTSTAHHVEHRDGRGRCLVASRSISVGESISPDERSEFFAPLVPPVLTVDNRASRCSLCFRLFSDETILAYDENNHSSMYPVLFCSYQCREKGMPWLAEEERMVIAVCSGLQQGAIIMPTALLLYRILCKIASEESRTAGPMPSTRSQIADLELHRDMEGSADAQNHARAVIALAKEMTTHTAKNSHSANGAERETLSGFDTKFVADILSKMKTNCFSICDGEMVALGLGLFPVASNINHSCQPNCIQTFMYGDQGAFPLLCVKACTAIHQNEEICISYTDNACPRRRERLKEGYNFWCTCQYCRDKERESQLVGLRCPKDGCSGEGKLQKPNGDIRNSIGWKCSRCTATDFHSALERVEKLSQMEPSVATSRKHSSQQKKRKESEKAFEELKSTCNITSWYVREAGERLFQGYLDSISSCKSESETTVTCAKALRVAEELLRSYEKCDADGWATLRTNILRYKAAKLRLFLYPDPRQSLQELQDVYTALSDYFPAKHELLEGLKLCIVQSSM